MSMARAVTAAGTSPGRGQFNQQGCKARHHFALAFHKSAAELEASDGGGLERIWATESLSGWWEASAHI